MKEEKQLSSESFGAAARLVGVASVATLLIGALASVWRLFAAQSPSSPLHVGPLVGPIDTLEMACWIAGFGGVALAALMTTGLLDRAPARKAAVLLLLGWGLILAGLLTGAILGTHGTQIIKAYPRTVAVLLLKLFGFMGVLSGLVALLIAAARGRRGGG